MGRMRAGASRSISAVLITVAATASFTTGAASAAADPASTGAADAPAPASTAPSSAAAPPLPAVNPSVTDGQPAEALLSRAVTLSSVGTDQTAILAAMASTQKKLDTDAVQARTADTEAAAATRAAQHDEQAARASTAAYRATNAAAKAAVILMYTAGPQSLVVDPQAGRLALYAQDYAESTLGPYGVLTNRLRLSQDRARQAHAAEVAAARAAADQRRAHQAVADQQRQLAHLKATLAAATSASSSTAITADHAALAAQAGHELISQNSLEFSTTAPLPGPVSTTPLALAWAFAELGKPYLWGGTGPDRFDCSGLTQFVWKAAGVQIPRVAADQDSWAVPVPLSQLLPGDLVFFGTSDIHHVGIYIGDGLMVDAPHTGAVVRVDSIWWSDLAGFGRVHYPGTPVPSHYTPTAVAPAPRLVSAPKPVPSQAAPPPGWTPTAGQSTPIVVTPPSGGAPDPSGGAGPTTTVPSGTASSTTAPTTLVPTTAVPSTPTPPTSAPDTTDGASGPSTTGPGSTTTTSQPLIPAVGR